MKHVITIPGFLFATINELLRSVATRIRRKKQDRAFVALYAKMAGVPEATGKRRVRLVITLGPRMKGSDPDSFFKSALDALVHAKMLINDSKEWVELLPVEYVRGDERATRIELEDCDD